MKVFVCILLVAVSTQCLAQLRGSGDRILGPVKTKRGLVLKENDDVRFGAGSLPSGWYKNVYASFDKFGEGKARIDEGYAYKHAVIKEFREVGSGSEKRLVALVKPKGGISVYLKAIDVEPAVDAKEIISINGVAISKLIAKKPL